MVRPSANQPGRGTPLIIAHRGESHDAPENTLAAVNLAWERGARAVEIDVRCSAEGEVFVIHDADTRRIGGPRRAVSRQSAEDLAAMDAGAWKHRRWKGERVPRLAEVLRTVPAHGRLFIELKGEAETVPAVLEVVRNSGLLPERLLLMSFQPSVVGRLVGNRCGIDVCRLLTARQWRSPEVRARMLRFASRHGLAGVDVEATPDLDRAFVDAMHNAGLLVYCWTVNRVASAVRLARIGIDGITTDRCERLTRALNVARD